MHRERGARKRCGKNAEKEGEKLGSAAPRKARKRRVRLPSYFKLVISRFPHLSKWPTFQPVGGGNGYPLQYSCLENPIDREAWGGYSPWGCKESDTTERLNTPPGCLSKQTGIFLIMPLSSQQQILSTPIYIWICSRLPCFSRIPPPHDPRPPSSALGDCNSLLSGPSASISFPPQPRPFSTQKTEHSSKAQRKSH